MNAGPRRLGWLAALAPGILVAATGVGAGDLLTASLAGSQVGVVILWAALLGAILKWTVNEGVARWQLATGTTLLEGWVQRLGGWIQWVFLIYLLVWSLATGGALVNACGVAGTGLWQIGDPRTSKIVWGMFHSLLGLVLVWIGGFRLFEKLMGVCIALMFVTVMVTVFLVPGIDWGGAAWGMLPGLVRDAGDGLRLPNQEEWKWIIAVLGGVGGTLTVLSYGYWIREAGREGTAGVRACRLDLGVGYTMTALFGLAMIAIGTQAVLTKGPLMALELADQLAQVAGPVGRWAFLIGFWGAVFSSLLGVWQSVPYLFADFLAIRRGHSAAAREKTDFTRTRAYRGYLIALAVVPLPLLWGEVGQVQLTYAVLGATFMPFLALTLLIMNRAAWVGRDFRSGPVINAILVVTVAFFAYQGVRTVYQKLDEAFRSAPAPPAQSAQPARDAARAGNSKLCPPPGFATHAPDHYVIGALRAAGVPRNDSPRQSTRPPSRGNQRARSSRHVQGVSHDPADPPPFPQDVCRHPGRRRLGAVLVYRPEGQSV